MFPKTLLQHRKGANNTKLVQLNCLFLHLPNRANDSWHQATMCSTLQHCTFQTVKRRSLGPCWRKKVSPAPKTQLSSYMPSKSERESFVNGKEIPREIVCLSPAHEKCSGHSRSYRQNRTFSLFGKECSSAAVVRRSNEARILTSSMFSISA